MIGKPTTQISQNDYPDHAAHDVFPLEDSELNDVIGGVALLLPYIEQENYVDTDAASGLPTGKRQHKPFSF